MSAMKMSELCFFFCKNFHLFKIWEREGVWAHTEAGFGDKTEFWPEFRYFTALLLLRATGRAHFGKE